MQISIVGIYKHDYAQQPEKLRELREGDTIWLQPEPDNPYDPRAIRALYAGRFIGYVQADQTPTVHAVMGDEPMCPVRFSSLSEEHKGIRAELDTDIATVEHAPSTMLSDWQPLGPVLHLTEEERNARSRIIQLEHFAKTQAPWDYTADYLLTTITADIRLLLSGDDRCRLLRAISHAQRSSSPQWREAGEQLGRALAKVNTPEGRELIYGELLRWTTLPDMDRILSGPEERVIEMLEDLPPAFADLYQEQPDLMIARLLSARLPDSKLRPLLTRLCVRLYLGENAGEESAEFRVHAPTGASAELDDQSAESARSAVEESSLPEFLFFTKKADENDREEITTNLAAKCKKVRGNSCTKVVRYLKSLYKQGLINNVFDNRPALLQYLQGFGFEWEDGTLKNTITTVLRER